MKTGFPMVRIKQWGLSASSWQTGQRDGDRERREGLTSTIRWVMPEGAPSLSSLGRAPVNPVLHTSSWASPFQALFAGLLLTLEDKLTGSVTTVPSTVSAG